MPELDSSIRICTQAKGYNDHPVYACKTIKGLDKKVLKF